MFSMPTSLNYFFDSFTIQISIHKPYDGICIEK